jgi:hypothetical protein
MLPRKYIICAYMNPCPSRAASERQKRELTRPVTAVAETRGVEPVDLVLFSVKS